MTKHAKPCIVPSMTTNHADTPQHMHEASHMHSIVSGFYQLADGVPLDDTATYRPTRPDLGAHYGRTLGHCRCGVEVIQLTVEGETAWTNRRGWVPLADIEDAYAENAERDAERDQPAEPAAPAVALNDAVTPTRGALRGEIGYVVKLGRRPWADVRFPKIGRAPYRFPLSSLDLVDEAVAR